MAEVELGKRRELLDIARSRERTPNRAATLAPSSSGPNDGPDSPGRSVCALSSRRWC